MMKRFLVYIGLFLLGVISYNIYLYVDYKKSIPDDDTVVVIKKGQEPEEIKNSKIAQMLRDLDKAQEKAKSNRKSDAEREKEFLEIWKDMDARMVDPEPGTYPVKYYAPDLNGIPLIVGLDNTRNDMAWVDNKHVLYWAGIRKDEMSGSRLGWKEKRLVLLNTETEEVVKEFNGFIVPHKTSTTVQYFKTNNEIAIMTRPFGGEYRWVYGHLDGEYNLQITEERDKPKEKYTPYSYYNLGEISARMTSYDWGKYTYERADGTKKKIDLDFHVHLNPKYDHVRDQYFLSASTKDQRNKIWYFDNDMNVVEEFWIGRVSFLYGYPGSFLEIPAKNGFVLRCSSTDTPFEQVKWGETKFSDYLCHVKYDGTMVRAVKGRVSWTSIVSPDGCRVFGFVLPEYTDKFIERIKGKNYMVDICVNNNLEDK